MLEIYVDYKLQCISKLSTFPTPQTMPASYILVHLYQRILISMNHETKLYLKRIMKDGRV